MRNRFLGGASFLPMFAAEGAGSGGGEQSELALDPAEIAAHGDPDFEANAAGDDPGDLNHSQADEKAEGDELPADGKTEADGAVVEKAEVEKVEEEPEDPKAVREQLEKTVKALGKRVSVLSKEKRELHSQLQKNIREVPQDEPVAATEDGDQPQRSDFKSKTEFDAAVEAAAERKADAKLAVQAFNAKCNDVESAGSKAFGDKWAKAKADLSMLDDQGRIPMDILSVALETDNPSRVLFVLGNDIEKATELMGMTPIKRAIAMDKIASAKAVDRPKSNTPAPVEPIGGRGAGDDRPSDRDSDEEWNRKEALRERRAMEEKRKLRGY